MLKKKWKWRKILDCRLFNRQIQVKSFKMEVVKENKDIIQQGDYVSSSNLHQLFHHIAAPIQISPFLDFYFEKKSFWYVGVSFGVAVASRIFTKTLMMAITEIRKRQKEIRIIVYSDNILLLYQQNAVLQHASRQIKRYLEIMGWQITEEKSTLAPMQIFKYLGKQQNLLNQTLFMTCEMR
ncbi:MAG: hypothetical protein EZS28_008305 [Streblomastix strix]|uniref:Reverse transcriptase domain-containing protein n=1 Tax=Streblomastix strix TaxID=222440 RepID=A0A5J4WM57_9EUKA|nr:MAG: hypothetical protein EZS28_008305 [Streblomastix strix]